MIDENIQKQVKEILREMREPVAMLFFGSETRNCDYCEPTRELLQELAPLSEKLSLEIYDIDAQAELAAQFHVDKVPSIVLAGKVDGTLVDYGIRYAGIPAGHEFSSLIHDLVLISKRDSGLSAATRAFLAQLDKPLHLQVFVTPT
jgi:glutaredoxin-like protein